MSKVKNPKTPVGRVSYPHVFRKAVYQDNKDEPEKQKYELTLLVPKEESIDELEELIAAATDEKWPDKKPRGLLSPIKDGDEADDENYHGHWAIKLKTKLRPNVVDRDRSPIDEESDDFYAGCYARASYRVYAYDNVSKGVALELQNVQKIRDGDPLGKSKSDPNDDFDDDDLL